MRVLVVNGPNLNLLGRREPEVYGSATLSDLETEIRGWGAALGMSVDCLQSNSEAEIVTAIQDFAGDALVINPGALSHTSRAIADAIQGVSIPAVEVHISNVRAREPWRAISFISPACVRTIYGRGTRGYRDALRHLSNRSAGDVALVAYGPHPEQVADLRGGGGGHLVVLVHGGLWRQEWERDQMDAIAVDLAGRGVDTLNLEYRRLGTGGGWPASGQDIAMALAHAHRTAGHERVTLLSHSAGAYLAAWAGARSTGPSTRHVAMAPILDLGSVMANGDQGRDEAAMLLAAGAPPVAGAGQVETVIVHGTEDEIVPFARSETHGRAHDVPVHRVDCGHFQLLDPAREEWATTLDLIGVPV